MDRDSLTAGVEDAVRTRYSAGAVRREASLCCPVTYDPALLDAIPAEVIERDYGCGDPTRHLQPGETVLDLGSGAGKACFLASQIVGSDGRVIGVDMNDEMLALARRAAPEVARRLGYGNVEFRKARIQDLRIDLEELDRHLAEHPVRSSLALLHVQDSLRHRQLPPVVADASVDVVVSNCVLNLVRPEDKHQLFAEMHRVLRPGGRVIISDIVSDEDVPRHLADDPDLWSGCISGAFREDLLLVAFEEAGLQGAEILERGEDPWRIVEGIEFRSLTVRAFRGEGGSCLDQGHAVIYRGPFREVRDDDGHVLRRGVRTAVCGKTWRTYGRAPYAEHLLLVPPHQPVPEDEVTAFPCSDGWLRRDPRVTKRGKLNGTSPATGCDPSESAAGGCC